MAVTKQNEVDAFLFTENLQDFQVGRLGEDNVIVSPYCLKRYCDCCMENNLVCYPCFGHDETGTIVDDFAICDDCIDSLNYYFVGKTWE